MKEYKNIVMLASIIGGSLVLSAFIGCFTAYKIRSLDNVLSVTGSASQHVVSDQVKWSSSFSRIVTLNKLNQGYADMASDLAKVKKFFTDNGIDESKLDISPITMSENYDDNSQSGISNYTLVQSIDLTSTDVQGVTALAKKAGDIVGEGVIFSTTDIAYSYSGLANLRVSLLSNALKDAKARASAIAQSDGEGVGSLRSAASGVVQVLPQNAIDDVSDYGTYDTASINKEVMVTVKATFSLN